jgi:hypothetical protein
VTVLALSLTWHVARAWPGWMTCRGRQGASPTLGCMPEGRPAIPAEMKRRVLMEAGHRCAIPACRTIPVEIAHIAPYAKVQDHAFENLIALCPTCHTRYDNGDIDRPSMKGYKANLGLVSGRYGEMERRILDMLAENPAIRTFRLPGGWDIQLMYLLKDGLIAKVPPQGGVIIINGLSPTEDYMVTSRGEDFVKRWIDSRPVSTEVEE